MSPTSSPRPSPASAPTEPPIVDSPPTIPQQTTISPTTKPTMIVSPENRVSRCGCGSTCTQDILERSACDSDGCFSCGSRIDWLMSSEGGSNSESYSCLRVAETEFLHICGPCNPNTCNMQTTFPPTKVPTKAPTMLPTTPAPMPTAPVAPQGPSPCGCNTCTQDILDGYVCDSDGCFSCGSRIDWLQSSDGGSNSEYNSCLRVGNEFPGVCGRCSPVSCNSQLGEFYSNTPTFAVFLFIRSNHL